jgi:hypothetical protein
MSIRDDLKAFVDGELSPERMSEVQAAVDADAELQREVEFMRLLGLEIKRLAAEPSVAGKAETMAKIRRGHAHWWSPFGPVGRWVLAGGAAVVLFVVVLPLLQREMSDQSVAYSRERMASPPATGDEPVARAVPSTPTESEGGLSGRSFDSGTLPDSAGAPLDYRPEAEAKAPQGSGTIREEPAKQAAPQSGATWANRSQRMVVQNADLAWRVEDVDAAVAETRSMTESLGGYIESQTSSGEEGERPTATLVLRVPAVRFEEAIERIRAMGQKIYENSNAEDVTRQYADVEGRIKVLRAEEESYVTMLRGARRIGEIIEIKDRLSSVRQELASYEQQRIALKDLATLSRISVRFEQRVAVDRPKPDENAFEDAWANAVNGLKAAGTFLGKVAIFLFVYSPIWLPVALVIWWLARSKKK